MNITKKRLLIYLGLSFGMAWLIFFIFIFTGHTWTGSSPEMLSLVSLGMLAPAIAHVITRKITNEGFRLIGEKSMMLGIDLKGKKWIIFLLAMFLPVVYSTLGDCILWLVFPEAFGETEYSLFVVIIYPLIAVVQGVVLSFAAFGEEFGWRGYALDRLLVRFGFLRGSLLLGFVWAIWHLPWYFTPGQAQYNLLQDSVFHALMFIPSVMMLSVFVSFVYVKTKRSILAGALVHMFSNLIGSQLLSSYTTGISMLIRYTNMLFFLCVIVYAAFSRRFKEEAASVIASILSREQEG